MRSRLSSRIAAELACRLGLLWMASVDGRRQDWTSGRTPGRRDQYPPRGNSCQSLTGAQVEARRRIVLIEGDADHAVYHRALIPELEIRLIVNPAIGSRQPEGVVQRIRQAGEDQGEPAPLGRIERSIPALKLRVPDQHARGRDDEHPFGRGGDRIDPAEVTHHGAIFRTPVPAYRLRNGAGDPAESHQHDEKATHKRNLYRSVSGAAGEATLHGLGTGRARRVSVVEEPGEPTAAPPSRARDPEAPQRHPWAELRAAYRRAAEIGGASQRLARPAPPRCRARAAGRVAAPTSPLSTSPLPPVARPGFPATMVSSDPVRDAITEGTPLSNSVAPVISAALRAAAQGSSSRTEASEGNKVRNSPG